jgi:hypothetical protein
MSRRRGQTRREVGRPDHVRRNGVARDENRQIAVRLQESVINSILGLQVVMLKEESTSLEMWQLQLKENRRNQSSKFYSTKEETTAKKTHFFFPEKDSISAKAFVLLLPFTRRPFCISIKKRFSF